MLAKREMGYGVKGCVYNRGSTCSALERMLCRNGNPCAIYKTEKDVELAEKRTIARLNSLPEEKQTEIADRLFGGFRPWKGEGTWDTRAR